MPKKGYKQSLKHRKKIANALVGKKFSPEHRKHLSDATRAVYAKAKRGKRKKPAYKQPKKVRHPLPDPNMLALLTAAKHHGASHIARHEPSGAYAVVFPPKAFGTAEEAERIAKLVVWKTAKKTPFGMTKNGADEPWLVTFEWANAPSISTEK